MSRRLLRVAVIGAGPSGLSACRHLISEPGRFEFVCYEQCASVGGAWYYAEDNIDYDDNERDDVDDNNDVEPNKLKFQSPMYKNLRTNSPTDCFRFPDFPFRDEHYIRADVDNDTKQQQLRSFVTHAEMLRYLRSYAEHFELMPHIRLNTPVEKVRLVHDSEPDELFYRITTIDTRKSGVRGEQIFDAVMVCVGRYIKPKWPAIKNLDKFQGKLMHSKYYRHPKQFPASNFKKIIVMGGGYSGIDVALDLDKNSSAKKQVILSIHSTANVGNLERWYADCNVQLKPDIAEVLGPNAVRFADDSIESKVDALLMATGYCYNFPFLSDEDGLALTVDDQRLTPLYKHMVHTNNPTVCFIGMIWAGLTIPQFDQQVKYFLASLKGSFALPSQAAMFAWAEQDLAKRVDGYKWPKRYAHKMGGHVQREYMESLCEESGIAPLDLKLFAVDDVEAELRLQDPVRFKLKNYVWEDELMKPNII